MEASKSLFPFGYSCNCLIGQNTFGQIAGPLLTQGPQELTGGTPRTSKDGRGACGLLWQ